MATMHIQAQPGDFAATVLMPGDPLRAKFIAENFLTDVKLVNTVRNIFGYTGLYQGKRVSVMASGMGMPSIGIYSYELFTHFGVEMIIRVGTCGAFQPDTKLFDILIAIQASTNSNWNSQYNLPGVFSAGADFLLAKKAYEQASKMGLRAIAGNVLSSDIFYDNDPQSWKQWASLGVLGVEMEAFALYMNAAKLGKKALTILSVTDHFITHEKASSEQREKGLKDMMKLALEIA
jgi:purine-nucleoside phosphorylase